VRLLAYFGEESEACGNCDNCLNPPKVIDGTEIAQKALSAVYRTGQRFGAGHLIDILRGNATERVQQLHHNELKTFGVGAALSDQQWRAVFRQLIALGFLEADAEAYGAFKLTEAARAVLTGGTQVALREEAEKPKGSKRGARDKRTARVLPANAGPGAPALLEALRAWRLKTAQEHGVPAYVIFHDATLAAVAAAQPRSIDDLHGISGIGATKLARYGEPLLEIVRGHAG
jgi:ATP-dependent DNA helicase RecQ